MKRSAKLICFILIAFFIISVTLITGCSSVNQNDTSSSTPQTAFELLGINDGGFGKGEISVNAEFEALGYTVAYSRNTDGTFPTTADTVCAVGTSLTDAGNYYIVITDKSGNSVASTFTIDKSAPTLTLVGVNNGGFTNGNVSATWGTETGTVTSQRINENDALTVKYSYNTDGTSPSAAATSYTTDSKLTEAGNYLLTIADSAGNYTSYTFTIDKTAPALTLVGVTDGGFTNGNVSASWTTSTGSMTSQCVNENDVLTVKYSYSTSETFPTNANTEYAPDTLLTEAGNYLLTITDSAGNYTSYTFTIDKIAPALTLIGVTDGGFTNGNVSATWGTETGTVTSQRANESDALTVKYSYGTSGTFPTVAEIEYVADTELAEVGNYLLTITDSAGNVGAYTFTIDNTAPTLTLLGVANGGFTNGSVSATWENEAGDSATLTVKYTYSTNATFPTTANTEYAPDTLLTEAGNYYMTITDSAGNYTSYTFTIDNMSPALTLIGVTDGGFTNGNVSATWSTETGTVTSQRINEDDVLTVKYSYNTDATFPIFATTIYNSGTALTNAGNYLLTITDSAGNYTAYIFTIDKTAPILTLTGAINGGFTNGNVSASWTTGTGSMTSQRVNSNDVLTVKYSYSTNATFPTVAEIEYVADTELIEVGNYLLTIADSAGNVGTYTFTIDRTAPILTLIGVTDGGFTNGNVSATWGTETETISSQRTNENDVLTIKYSYSTSATFPTEANIEHIDGELTEAGNYYMTITDSAGNYTAYTFTIDKTAPILTLTGVINGGFTNGNVSASWTTGTGSMTSQRVNSNDVLTIKYSYSTSGTFPTVAESEYIADTELIEVGNYLLTIADSAGNVGTYTFTIDRTAPILTLIGVTDGGFTNGNVSATWGTETETISSQRANTKDVLTIAYSYNTDEMFPTEADIEYSGVFTEAGNYYMIITDSAGNYTAYTFTIDKTAPALTLIGVTDGGFTNGNVSATWSSETGTITSQRANENDILTIKYSYSTNATFPTVAEIEYAADTELVEVGNYLLTITDSAGNVTAYTFTIDKTAPTLTLTGVADGGFTNSNVSATWGTETETISSQRANENDVLTVKYSYNTSATFPTVASNEYTSGSALTLIGNYYMTITDSAGNYTAYTFTIDKTAPILTLTGVINGGFTNGNVSATWSTSVGSMISQRVNNRDTLIVKYAIKTDGTFPTQTTTEYSANAALTEAGNYLLTIADSASNVSIYKFTIDKTAPTLRLIGINDNGFGNGEVSTTWGAETGTIYSQRANTKDVLTVAYSYNTDETFPTEADIEYSGGVFTEVGNYYMTITDSAGNYTAYTFTIDKTAPILTLTGAINGGFTNGNVSASWTTGTGSMTSQRVNSNDVLTVKYSYSTSGTFPTVAEIEYTADTELIEVGNYLLTITDSAGNVGAYTFTIDRTAPTLTLVGVTDGGFTNSNVSATWGTETETISSQRANENDVLTVKYSYSTNAIFPTVAESEYIADTELTEVGNYLLTITDSSGNNTAYTFTIDKTAPALTLIGVTDGGFTNGNVSASWTTGTGSMMSQCVNENDVLTVKYSYSTSGTFPTVAESEYIADTELTEVGNYLLTITDSAGNVGAYTFTIDNTAPTLTLIGVTDGGFTNNNVSATWSTETGTMISQRVNYRDEIIVKFSYSTDGTFPTAANTSYLSGNTLSSAGNYLMTIRDSAGNSTTYTFTIDRVAPTLTGVTNGEFKNEDVSITWGTGIGTVTSQRANENDVLTVKYSYNTDGTFPTTASIIYNSGTALTNAGNYLLTIADSAGNVGTYTFTIDRTAPTLTLVGVTDGGFTNGNVSATWSSETGTITSQRANESDVLTVKYSYSTDGNFPTIASTVYISGVVLTNAGNYLMTITDKAGNVGAYTFTIDKAAPTLALDGVVEGFANGAVTVTWGTETGTMESQRVNDNDTLTVKYAYNPDVDFPTEADTLYIESTQFTETGSYYVTITDRAGNIGAYTFIIDKTAPTLTLSGVIDGGFTNGNVSATWGTETGSLISQRVNDNDVLTVTYSYNTAGTFPKVAETVYTAGEAISTAGNYLMTITDSAGNCTSYTFTIDKTAPALAFTGVTSGGFTKNNVTVTWGTSYSSGVAGQRSNENDVLTVKYSFNTDATFPATATTACAYGFEFTNVGNYYMTITDSAGNVGTATFTIDKSAPTLTLSGVYNGGFSNTGVSATWNTDMSSMTSQLTNNRDALSVKYALNTSGVYPTAATTTYTAGAELTETGYYLMTISDSAGNTTSYVFSIDTTVESYIFNGVEYIMTWRDEFDGNSLDTSKWYCETGTGSGTQAGWRWGNAELESYQSGNATVDDGSLKITAIKNGSSYTSARINTRGSSITDTNAYDTNSNFSQTYGRFEARIKLPAEQGLWPAFWLMPVTNNYGETVTMWPFNGEIDIMEARGRVPDAVSSAVHYSGSSGSHAQKKLDSDTTLLGSDFSITDWHVYAVEWTAEKMDFYVDNIKTLTVSRSTWHSGYYADQTESAPFDQPFYIILNLAVGGNFDGGTTPDENFTQATMEVDYVRVYQSYDILNNPD